MAELRLHKKDWLIQLKHGARSKIGTQANTNLGVQGEPIYTTDTKQLFIFDGTEYLPVQSLDMALIDEDYSLSVDENFQVMYDY